MRDSAARPNRADVLAAVQPGRVSLLPVHVVRAFPEDERVAVQLLEYHLWLRQQRPDPALELLPDGSVGVFLTIGYVQKLLREIGARKTGEDYAAEVLNAILPRLGLIEQTNLAKKPRADVAHPGEQRETGGRHAQRTPLRSYWWRIFKLPTLTKLVTPIAGAYSRNPGTPPPRPLGSASLFGLLRCQGLISPRRRKMRFLPGSVQAAFHATGPP